MTTNKIVANALKAKNSVATNANRVDQKRFGNGDVTCTLKDFGNGLGYEISIDLMGLTSSSSWNDQGKVCIADARDVLKAFERKASALKQAIAWMEQNAKKW